MERRLLLKAGMSFEEGSLGQMTTVTSPATPMTMPDMIQPGICMVIKRAPTRVPRELPTRLPADMNADMVARCDSGTRSDREATTGEIIMFRPTMARQ